MTGRSPLRRLPALGLALAALLSAAGCARDPDALVIFVDTLRHDRLGCREAVGLAPTLESLTLEGTCFERVASTSGWTLPSSTSMLYSAYPEEHGVEQRHQQVAAGVVALSAPLAEAGYASAWFSGNILTSQPQYQRDFDKVWVVDRDHGDDPDIDAQVVDQALAWLEEQPSRDPLLLVLQLYGPHYPYCPPGTGDATVAVDGLDEPLIDLCDPGHDDLLRAAEELQPFPTALAARAEELYDGEVAATDAEVARLLDAWGEHRGTRPRLTVVVTDHGEAFAEHGRVLHGRSLHRETSDCHLAFHGAGAGGAAIERAVVDRPVELLDLPPTVLSYLELEVPDGWRGLDLTALAADPGLDLQARAYQTSVLLEGTQRAVTLEGPDGHRYRLLRWEETGDKQLFDATADPLETEDLAGDPAHADLELQLELFLDEMVATAAAGGPPRE